MWTQFLRKTVLEPLLRRVGTAAATALLVGGDYVCDHWGACGLVNESGALAVTTWVVAAALVATDIALSYLDKKKVEKAVRNARP